MPSKFIVKMFFQISGNTNMTESEHDSFEVAIDMCCKSSCYTFKIYQDGQIVHDGDGDGDDTYA